MAKKVFTAIVRPDTPDDVTVVFDDGSIDVISREAEDGSDLVEFFLEGKTEVEFW